MCVCFPDIWVYPYIRVCVCYIFFPDKQLCNKIVASHDYSLYWLFITEAKPEIDL